MFFSQTMDEYLDNPMGKGSTAISNRNLIKTDLNTRYDKLLKRHKDFKHNQYFDGVNYYIHVFVPSESERENTYDVVIELSPLEDSNKIETTLKNYQMRVFSNCPSFTYTYAYVYNDNGMLIPFLRNRYKNIVLTDNPQVKNPGEVINYDKSIYFACKYITTHTSLMSKMMLSATVKKIDKEKFYEGIRTSDVIELEIKKENNRLKEEKEKRLKKFQSTALGKALAVEKQVKKAKRSKAKITPKIKVRPKAKIKPK